MYLSIDTEMYNTDILPELKRSFAGISEAEYTSIDGQYRFFRFALVARFSHTHGIINILFLLQAYLVLIEIQCTATN